MRNSVQIFLHHVENFFFSAAITVTVHKEVKEAVSKRDLTKKFILKKWTKMCEIIPKTKSEFFILAFFYRCCSMLVLFSQLLVLLCSFKFCCKTLSMSLIQWWWYDVGIVWFEKKNYTRDLHNTTLKSIDLRLWYIITKIFWIICYEALAPKSKVYAMEYGYGVVVCSKMHN